MQVAVGITHARLHWGLRYVAVVDIDVHFGNGECMERAHTKIGLILEFL